MAEQTLLVLPNHNIHVVGAFNPRLIRPEWVTRNVGDPELKVAEVLFPPEFDAPPLFRADHLFWSVSSERLVAHHELPERTALFVSTILEKLPHTPIRAVGINFQFKKRVEGTRVGAWYLASDQDRAAELLGGAPVWIRVAESAVRKDGTRLNLSLTRSQGADEAVMEANFHLEVSGQDEQDRARQVVEHVRRSSDFLAEAKRILEAL